MDIRKLNHRAGWLVADYLNDNPCSVTPGMVRDTLSGCDGEIDEETVYASLLAMHMGLDDDSSAEDRLILDYYLVPGLKRLDPSVYRQNPYYLAINACERKVGNWMFSYQAYRPYELFLRDDLILTDDMRQIPALGYFPEEFRYLSVMQDGREWMSIKPSEIESSQAAVDAASGRVVTFGLGLGYFAYMAALKPEVASVTVVERDPSVIKLFGSELLPQFCVKDKISVIQCDAFDYLEHRMSDINPDFVFMDIWHDIADGTGLYVRARQYERRFPATRFMYWIERSLKCALIDGLEDLAAAGPTGRKDVLSGF